MNYDDVAQTVQAMSVYVAIKVPIRWPPGGTLRQSTEDLMPGSYSNSALAGRSAVDDGAVPSVTHLVTSLKL